MTQSLPTTAFEIFAFITTPHLLCHFFKQSKNQCVNTKSSEKSQKTLNQQIGEKSVDRKAHRPALTNEVRNRRSRGIFCRKDFCTNLLIHNLYGIFVSILHLQNFILLYFEKKYSIIQNLIYLEG